jgi:hypothetical protein
MTDDIPPRWRVFLMCVRQALIIALGGLEDLLGVPRSITPRHCRE